MSFPRTDVEQLLARCHRRCCICHRFCGTKIETDHIVPAADGGPDTIENAIAVCFECHAEIHSYNDRHPRGRKFRPSELKLHKQQWLQICRATPASLLQSARSSDVGPLQALIDELAFNGTVARQAVGGTVGCEFYDHQFLRAIERGAIAVLQPDLQAAILQAYAAIGRANTFLRALHGSQEGLRSYSRQAPSSRAADAVKEALPSIEEAQKVLLQFLQNEDPAG